MSKKKAQVLRKKLPFPDLRIDCYGEQTHVYLDGMEIDGILSVSFKAGGSDKKPVLKFEMHPWAARPEKVREERVATALVTSRHMSDTVKS